MNSRQTRWGLKPIKMDEVTERLILALRRPSDGSSDFDLNPGIGPPMDRPLRAAAVLVPVFLGSKGASLLLTKRSSALAHHPGQVALPGGKVDPGDKSAVDAALREAEEEVGLPRSHVTVLGQLAPHTTVTAFEVSPVIGVIHEAFEPEPEAGEVEEAFFVPLEHVLDKERFTIESRRWQGMPRYYYTVPFGPYYIWGATARILRGLAERYAL